MMKLIECMLMCWCLSVLTRTMTNRTVDNVELRSCSQCVILQFKLQIILCIVFVDSISDSEKHHVYDILTKQLLNAK